MKVGDMVLVKKAPSGTWTGFMGDISPDKYGPHLRRAVSTPQFGVVMKIDRLHVLILLSSDALQTWLPLYALEEMSR